MDNTKLIQQIRELILDLKYEPYKDLLNQNFEILDDEENEEIILKNIKNYRDKQAYSGDCEDLSYIALKRINNKFPKLRIQIWQGNNQKEFKDNTHIFILIKNSQFSKSQNIIVDPSLKRIEIEKTSKYKKNKLIVDTQKKEGIIVYNDKIIKYYNDYILYNDTQSNNKISYFFHGVHKIFGLLHEKEIIEDLTILEKYTKNKEFIDFVKNKLNEFKISKAPKDYKLRNEIIYFKK
jgi:hypothetical protein